MESVTPTAKGTGPRHRMLVPLKPRCSFQVPFLWSFNTCGQVVWCLAGRCCPESHHNIAATRRVLLPRGVRPACYCMVLEQVHDWASDRRHQAPNNNYRVTSCCATTDRYRSTKKDTSRCQKIDATSQSGFFGRTMEG